MQHFHQPGALTGATGPEVGAADAGDVVVRGDVGAANGFHSNLDTPIESALHNDCICQRVEDAKQLFICVLLDDILCVGIKICTSS